LTDRTADPADTQPTSSYQRGGNTMGATKKIKPKATGKKTEKTAAKADKKVERKTNAVRWSDAEIKHSVTRLG
jgi:hypothetical protein